MSLPEGCAKDSNEEKCPKPTNSKNSPREYAKKVAGRKKWTAKPAQSGNIHDVELIGPDNIDRIAIEGRRASCLIDSGSNVSTVSETYYRQILKNKEMHSLASLIMKGAGEHTLPYLGYTFVNCSPLASKMTFNVPMLVVPDTQFNRSVPILVGTNLLEEIKNNNIPVHGAWQLAVRNLSRSPQQLREVAIYTMRPITLLPHQTAIVEAKVGATRQYKVGVIEVDDNLPGSIVSPHAVVNATGKTVHLQLINLSPNRVQINKGRKIGTMTPVKLIETEGDETYSTVHQMEQQCADHQCDDIPEEVDLNDAPLTQEQVKIVHEMLRRNKAVFAANSTELGCAAGVEHSIKLSDDTPIKEKPRRIPPGLYEEVKRHIEEMLAVGAIKRSASPWSTNVVLVRKNDGRLRVCIDYRKLNAKTIRDAYNIPLIEETLDRLTGACWFSTLDL